MSLPEAGLAADVHTVAETAYYRRDFVASMRWPVAVAALLLLAGPAAASLLESTTSGPLQPLQGTPADHVHYQVDAGTEYDAPDTCEEALASGLPFDLPVGGNVSGMLVPVDDTADHYRVPVGQALVGGRVTVSVLGHALALPAEMDVLMPGCGTSVAAPENQPAPPPADPAPGPGQKQVAPHNLDSQGWTCSDRWFFVLNQFGGQVPPATVHATWTDGSQADVPLLKDTPATMAQYATPEHQGFTLRSATANVPAGWSGQFNVAEGPCGAVDGHATFGEPATVGDGSIAFTPTEAGLYVLVVRAVPPEAPGAPPLGTAVPASCHQFCAFLPQSGQDQGGYTGLAF